MEEKKINIDHFQDQHHTYLEILSWYRSEIGWYFNSGENTIHTVPFILTCSAALECSLNDYIIKHLTDTHGEQGKFQIPGFLSMTLKGKLINIVPLLTSNKFIINVDHIIYQTLAELVKIRNRFVHNKSSYETHAGLIKENVDGKPYIAIPEKLKSKISSRIDPTFGVRGNIGKYHDCLERFHELFFDVYSTNNYDGNDLIVKIKDGNTVLDANLTIRE